MEFWYPRYVPVGARRARALQEMRALRARGVKAQPVEIKGRAIVRSFWGRRWCEHLESFSDYANRLPRGRSYVRNGSVCHLAVESGGVEAMVAGGSLYHVAVRIRRLKKPTWKAIRSACAGQIGSGLELLQGRLSDHVMDVVTHREAGLFPQPGEIKLACDCPDWATMCKHAAAVLYGVGSRLDDSPELLFRLRGVDETELIADGLTPPRETATADTLAGEDLGSIFGIDLGSEDGAPRARPPRPAARKRSKTARTRKAPRRRSSPAAAPSAPPAAGQAGGASPRLRLAGAQIAGLRERCGFSVAEFAELLQVSGATVRRWEAAPRPLDLRARSRQALEVLLAEIEKRSG